MHRSWNPKKKRRNTQLSSQAISSRFFKHCCSSICRLRSHLRFPRKKEEVRDISNFDEYLRNFKNAFKLASFHKFYILLRVFQEGKLNLSTSFDPQNPQHMLESINLSDFAFRQFSKSALKELLDSIVDMRCLHSLVLQNNGINDTYVEEISQLLNLT